MITPFKEQYHDNDVDAHIFSDKTMIVLPVPLGTTLYECYTDCCSICHYDKVLRNRIDDANDGKCIACESLAPCHTIFKEFVHEFEVTLNSVEYLLKRYHVTLWDTPEQALEMTKQRVAKHRAYMEACGMRLDERGFADRDYYKSRGDNDD